MYPQSTNVVHVWHNVMCCGVSVHRTVSFFDGHCTIQCLCTWEMSCRYHIAFAEDPVAVIEAIGREGFPQLMEEDALASKLYPTLTRSG